MATTKSIIRRHLISKGMEKILHLKNELFKIEQEDYLGLLKADESGLASIKINAGKVPTFSGPTIDLGNGTYISIDIETFELKDPELFKTLMTKYPVSIDFEALKKKDPELFETLLAKYPTEIKTRGADTASVSCTPKGYALAAEELGIDKKQLDNIQTKAKQYKVK